MVKFKVIIAALGIYLAIMGVVSFTCAGNYSMLAFSAFSIMGILGFLIVWHRQAVVANSKLFVLLKRSLDSHEKGLSQHLQMQKQNISSIKSSGDKMRHVVDGLDANAVALAQIVKELIVVIKTTHTQK